MKRRNYQWFDAWSRRPKPRRPDLGVRENAPLLLFSQDERIFKANDDRIGGWRLKDRNDCRRKKTEEQGLIASGFASDALGS